MAPVTCDQPEPADLGVGLLAFGAVAHVSVPVEDASTGIIDTNASMSSAYTQFWAALWEEPSISTPFVAAGYEAIGKTLLELNATVPDEPNRDRDLIDAWAKALRVDRWFKTVER